MRLTKYMREAFVRAAMQDVPSIDYDEAIRDLLENDIVSQMPMAVRTVYQNPALRHFLADDTQWVRCSRPSITYTTFGGLKPSALCSDQIDKLMNRRHEQQLALDKLRDTLVSVVNSVTTRQALVKALPEFEKYLPAAEAKIDRTVPVVTNVVAEFQAAGWPKATPK